MVAIKAEIGDLGWNIWQHANIQENIFRKMYDSSMEVLLLGLWFINRHKVTDTEVKRKYDAIPTKGRGCVCVKQNSKATAVCFNSYERWYRAIWTDTFMKCSFPIKEFTWHKSLTWAHYWYNIVLRMLSCHYYQHLLSTTICLLLVGQCMFPSVSAGLVGVYIDYYWHTEVLMELIGMKYGFL